MYKTEQKSITHNPPTLKCFGTIHSGTFSCASKFLHSYTVKIQIMTGE